MPLKRYLVLLLAFVFFGSAALAQYAENESGFDIGNFWFFPELELLGAYDKKDGSSGDFYAETTASTRFNNGEALYGIGGSGHYGYRAYDENSEASDDFYGFSGALSSEASPLKLSASVNHAKTVDYETKVKDGGGSNLPDILTARTSTRTRANAGVGYERLLSEKTSLLPRYDAMYYEQTIAGLPDLKWYEHSASLRVRYAFSSRTLLSLLGRYDLQFGNDEDGTVTTVSVGAESRYSDKLSWSGAIGVSAADYEETGTDQGMQGSLNVHWQPTEKTSAYVFGESAYQPGTGSLGARQVYRAGYGGGWAIWERVRLSAQILHDRQETIKSGQVETRHFANGKIEYDVGRRVTVNLSGSYIAEEEDADRRVVSCGAVFAY